MRVIAGVRTHGGIAVVAAAAASLVDRAWAQDAEVTPPEVEPPAQQAPAIVVGDSPRQVPRRLDESRAPRAGLLKRGPVSLLDPLWDGMNSWLESHIGLRLGLEYTMAFQAASDGPKDRLGASGEFSFYGEWRFLGEADGKNVGTLNFNAEYHHGAGGVAPAALGDDLGALWGTADTFDDDLPFSLVQLYYQQYLFDDRALLIAGKIDTTNYIATSRYADDTQFFMNRAFSSNPGVNYPDYGLGAVFAVAPSELFYMGVCIADANGIATRSGFDSIDEGDFFYAGQIAFTPSIEGGGKGSYGLTIWRSDAAQRVETPGDWGIALVLEQELSHGIVPFFKYSWSDGDATGVRNFVAGGVGFEGPFGRDDDVIGIGLSWGEPSDSSGDDQFAAEVFYRLQVSTSIQWTIGLQVLDGLDESAEDSDAVWVLETRFRISF